MMHKKIIGGTLIAVGIIVLIISVLNNQLPEEDTVSITPDTQETSMSDSVDIVLDFYDAWLKAVQSTSTNPYAEELATKGILGKELRTRLIHSEGRIETDIDPVLCQTTTPSRVTGRIVSKGENEIQVLVMAREDVLTAQSVFILKPADGGWFIEDIICYPGEFEVPREFSFDREGYLLKSVPPPYDPERWHLVFENKGVLGHVVPLFFRLESSCVATDAQVAVCTPDQFIEAKKVHIYGQMTELGVDVTRLEFLE